MEELSEWVKIRIFNYADWNSNHLLRKLLRTPTE